MTDFEVRPDAQDAGVKTREARARLDEVQDTRTQGFLDRVGAAIDAASEAGAAVVEVAFPNPLPDGFRERWPRARQTLADAGYVVSETGNGSILVQWKVRG